MFPNARTTTWREVCRRHACCVPSADWMVVQPTAMQCRWPCCPCTEVCQSWTAEQSPATQTPRRRQAVAPHPSRQSRKTLHWCTSYACPINCVISLFYPRVHAPIDWWWWQLTNLAWSALQFGISQECWLVLHAVQVQPLLVKQTLKWLLLKC